MRSPVKTAGVLDKRLRIWRSIIAERYSIPVLGTVNESPELVESQGNISFSQQYRMPNRLFKDARSMFEHHELAPDVVLGKVITSRGRLLDLLEFIECCWPDRKAWCDQRRQRSSLPTTSHYWAVALHETLIASGSQENFIIGNLKHRLESAEDHLRYDENWIPELEILYEYHDAKARLRGLIDIDMDLSEGLGLDATIDEIAYAAKERHRTLENSELEPLYREYVFNERLFLWGEETTRYARATQYRFIYDVANLNTATLDEVTRDTLDGWVRWLALEGSD